MNTKYTEIDPLFSDLISVKENGGYTVKFKENQSYQMVGKSKSGKTRFIHQLLLNASEVIDSTKNIEILYCYKAYQNRFDWMKSDFSDNISFHQGILSTEDIFHAYGEDRGTHLIIVIDDLMREAIDSTDLLDLFTIHCHHSNCSVMMSTHNLFQQGKYSKTLSVNAGYVTLFETPACIQQIKTFGLQRFPDPNLLVRAYKQAVIGKWFGYLVIDMTVNVPQDLRVRTAIFPNEETVFYI